MHRLFWPPKAPSASADLDGNRVEPVCKTVTVRADSCGDRAVQCGKLLLLTGVIAWQICDA